MGNPREPSKEEVAHRDSMLRKVGLGPLGPSPDMYCPICDEAYAYDDEHRDCKEKP